MQPLGLAPIFTMGKKALIRDLTGRFASALIDWKSSDPRDAISSCA
jgi:hypothetical protein